MANAVTLTFLGCGDAFGSGGRLNTCFYVRAPSARFLIDCGATALPALHREGLTSDDIDTILITHFHGDHFGGLPFLFLDAARQRRRQQPLTVVAPQGGEQRTRELMEQLYPGTSGAMDELDLRFVEYEAHQPVDLGPMRITAFPVVHSDAALSHGLRITIDEKVIGFSGDTSWTEELRSIAEGADLMICECNFFDTQTSTHLDYQTLKQHMHELKASHVVLNHLGEEMLRKLDQVAVTCARDGLELTL